MSAHAPTFGRRAAPVPDAPRAAPSPPPAGDRDLGPEARRLLDEIAAEKALGAPGADSELRDWKRAHRTRMWSAAGPWRYWACLLGVLSFAGNVHDFGPATEPVAIILRGLGGACAVMAFCLGLRGRKT